MQLITTSIFINWIDICMSSAGRINYRIYSSSAGILKASRTIGDKLIHNNYHEVSIKNGRIVTVYNPVTKEII